jgi:hypothetical protein
VPRPMDYWINGHLREHHNKGLNRGVQKAWRLCQEDGSDESRTHSHLNCPATLDLRTNTVTVWKSIKADEEIEDFMLNSFEVHIAIRPSGKHRQVENRHAIRRVSDLTDLRRGNTDLVWVAERGPTNSRSRTITGNYQRQFSSRNIKVRVRPVKASLQLLQQWDVASNDSTHFMCKLTTFQSSPKRSQKRTKAQYWVLRVRKCEWTGAKNTDKLPHWSITSIKDWEWENKDVVDKERRVRRPRSGQVEIRCETTKYGVFQHRQNNRESKWKQKG